MLCCLLLVCCVLCPLQEVLEEVSQLFPDPWLHLGGDEVDYDCWKVRRQHHGPACLQCLVWHSRS